MTTNTNQTPLPPLWGEVYNPVSGDFKDGEPCYRIDYGGGEVSVIHDGSDDHNPPRATVYARIPTWLIDTYTLRHIGYLDDKGKLYLEGYIPSIPQQQLFALSLLNYPPLD